MLPTASPHRSRTLLLGWASRQRNSPRMAIAWRHCAKPARARSRAPIAWRPRTPASERRRRYRRRRLLGQQCMPGDQLVRRPCLRARARLAPPGRPASRSRGRATLRSARRVAEMSSRHPRAAWALDGGKGVEPRLVGNETAEGVPVEIEAAKPQLEVALASEASLGAQSGQHGAPQGLVGINAAAEGSLQRSKSLDRRAGILDRRRSRPSGPRRAQAHLFASTSVVANSNAASNAARQAALASRRNSAT